MQKQEALLDNEVCAGESMNNLIKLSDNVIDILADKLLKVNTRRLETIGNLKNGFHAYEPTPYRVLISIFRSVDINENDVFIDVGCGLGRVLIVALKMGYKNVVGLDIDEKNVDICKNNLIRVTKKNKEGFYKVINVSSEDFCIKNNYNTFFFFNPFELKHFIKFVRKISKLKNIVLIIFCPTEGYIKYIESKEEYELLKVLSYNKRDMRCSTYIYKKFK